MGTTAVYSLPYQELGDPPDGPALGRNLAEAVEDTLQSNLTLGANLTVPGALSVGGAATVTGTLTAGGVNIGSLLGAIHTDGINNVCVIDASSSSSFANLASTSSFSFTKRLTSTKLKIDFAITSYAGGINIAAEFAVLIGGTDYVVAHMHHTVANTHTQTAGCRIITGISAAALTVQGRWRRVSGASPLGTDFNDWLSIACTELP